MSSGPPPAPAAGGGACGLVSGSGSGFAVGSSALYSPLPGSLQRSPSPAGSPAFGPGSSPPHTLLDNALTPAHVNSSFFAPSLDAPLPADASTAAPAALLPPNLLEPSAYHVDQFAGLTPATPLSAHANAAAAAAGAGSTSPQLLGAAGPVEAGVPQPVNAAAGASPVAVVRGAILANDAAMEPAMLAPGPMSARVYASHAASASETSPAPAPVSAHAYGEPAMSPEWLDTLVSDSPFSPDAEPELAGAPAPAPASALGAAAAAPAPNAASSQEAAAADAAPDASVPAAALAAVTTYLRTLTCERDAARAAAAAKKNKAKPAAAKKGGKAGALPSIISELMADDDDEDEDEDEDSDEEEEADLLTEQGAEKARQKLKGRIEQLDAESPKVKPAQAPKSPQQKPAAAAAPTPKRKANAPAEVQTPAAKKAKTAATPAAATTPAAPKTPAGAAGQFKCGHCERSFGLEAALKQHTSTKHAGATPAKKA